MPGIVIGDRIIMFKNNDGHVEVDGKKIVYSILISNDERLVVKIGDSVKDIVCSLMGQR